MADSDQTETNSSEETVENQELDNSFEEGPKTERDFSLVNDLPLTVSVEYGRTKISVDDFLSLKKGSVVEVDKLAGEALEFLMNGRVIAKGEAVVMNERYAIRLTDIVNQMQMLED